MNKEEVLDIVNMDEDFADGEGFEEFARKLDSLYLIECARCGHFVDKDTYYPDHDSCEPCLETKKLEELNMHQDTLRAIFLSMMYVARQEGIKVESKYYELEELINDYNGTSLTDMIDNFENVYKLVDQSDYDTSEDE